MHTLTDPPAGRAGAILRALAVGLLTACVVGRLFAGELPFRLPILPVVAALEAAQASPPDRAHLDMGEPARATFALAILTAGAMWLVGGALARHLTVRRPWLAVLIGLFAVSAFVSGFGADDKRSGLLVWLEQTALLTAMWLAAQMFVNRRRFNLLVAVLVAAGATLALKGLYQAAVELPEALAWRAALAPGETVDTVFERLSDARLRAAQPAGWLVLANVYAAALIVLAAAATGLGIDRLRAGRRELAELRSSGPPGQIPLSLIQGACTGGVALLCAAALILTGSRGAIGAGAAAIAGGVGVAVFGRRLARHWRKAVAAALLLIVLAAALTVAYGAAHDGLPTKTMRFRWYYWTASAEIVAERPLLGVGGGNFADAYLRHRRPEAEEAVRAPHNMLVHAAVQFGLIGGGLYMVILLYGLIGSCRPDSNECSASGSASAIGPLVAAGMLGVVVVVVRVVVGQATANWGVIVLDVVLPAAVLAGGVLLLAPRGDAAEARATSTARVALACGVAAFALHNLISPGLWAPGAAMLFWVAVGALLAQAPSRALPVTTFRWPVAAIAIMAVALVLMSVNDSTWAKARFWRRAKRAIETHQLKAAAANADWAASADLADGLSAAESAKLWWRLASSDLLPGYERKTYLTLGDRAARRAIARQRGHGPFYQLLAASPSPDELLEKSWAMVGAASRHELLAAAVALDPANARLRISHAEALLTADLSPQASDELATAERLNARLPADSSYRLDEGERAHLAQLRQRAGDSE